MTPGTDINPFLYVFAAPLALFAVAWVFHCLIGAHDHVLPRLKPPPPPPETWSGVSVYPDGSEGRCPHRHTSRAAAEKCAALGWPRDD